MRTFHWNIEDIVSAHPDLYLEHCAAMAVAVMQEHSRSPCELLVECEGFCPPRLREDGPFKISVAWTQETALRASRLQRTEQTTPIVERAAVALASLSFAHLVPISRMRVTRQGDLADYWLPGLRCALEVSGTRRPRELKRRCREKAIQVLGNPRRWDGYVFVCCFHRRQSLIRWSYYKQEE
jgi:hypothetical protein